MNILYIYAHDHVHIELRKYTEDRRKCFVSQQNSSTNLFVKNPMAWDRSYLYGKTGNSNELNEFDYRLKLNLLILIFRDWTFNWT